MPSSITLTVKHLPSSTSFFLSALQPLDYIYRGRVDNTIGFGLKDSPPDFWISQETPGVPAGAAHVAFPASSQRNVKDFFIAALKAGGKCHGEPLLRDPATGYYSAAIIDLDENSIEAVYRPDLLESDSDRSRPGSVSSVGSVKSKSNTNMSIRAPTVVSKVTTAKVRSSTATEVKSVAPSQALSKAPSQISRAPTSASKASNQVSRAPTAAPTQVSRAPSQQSVARAPTTVSRAPTSTPQQTLQSQTVTHTAPTGEVINSIITEARNTINIARELVNQARPALDSSNSAPNLPTSKTAVDPQSHQPSDTIVGTLLGVAAGAALHYAYTKATETKSPPPPQQFDRGPSLNRTATEPSYAYDAERAYYYHDHINTPTRQPYAIEAPPSEYGYAASQAPSQHSQRYITMHDTDERLSDVAPTAVTGRPRRRSSFSGIDVRSFTSESQSRASQNQKNNRSRMLEAPPTSYKAPTAITMAESGVSGRSGSRSRSKSRLGSVVRAASTDGSNHSRRSSRHGSDEDLRSSARSHATRKARDDGSRVSRRTSASKSRAPSVAGSDARTVIPIKPSASPSVAPSQASASKPPTSVSRATTTTAKPSPSPPDQIALPASRAGTTISASPSDYHSTHSKSHKTVIGKMLERDGAESGGGRGLTRSVVGKIADARNVGVTNREVDPSESVSQVSSNHSRKTGRSK